jgi:uncharacterized membrane protein
MKSHTTLRRILKGIILVILPILLVVFVFIKAKSIIQKQVLPVASQLPGEKFLGIGLISLISLVIVLLISYFVGMLIENKRMKAYYTFLEQNLLIFIPGYLLMKTKLTETSVDENDKRKVVLVGENDEWKLGIEIDRHPDDYCTIFFPFPPDAKSGEIKVVHESKFKRLDIHISKLVNILRNYGHGAADFIK